MFFKALDLGLASVANSWTAVDDAKHAASVLAILAFKLCCVPSWAVLGQAIGEDEQLPGRLVALLQPLIAGTAAALQ